MVGTAGWSAAAATYPAGQWVGEKEATVSATAAGGSLIVKPPGSFPACKAH